MFGTQTVPTKDARARRYPHLRTRSAAEHMHMSNPPRANMSKRECGLCAAAFAPPQEQMSFNPVFLTCSVCDRFFDESIYKKNAVAGYKKKQVNKFAVVKSAREKSHAGDEGTGASEKFEKQSIGVISCEQLKERYGRWPDAATISQARAMSRTGDYVTGVAIATDEPPTLLLNTTRRIKLIKPILTTERHKFPILAEILLQPTPTSPSTSESARSTNPSTSRSAPTLRRRSTSS